jgi:hypothetical protein
MIEDAPKSYMLVGLLKLCARLLVCFLAACKGNITSPEPLLSPTNASYPFPPISEIEAEILTDHHVWERIEGRAHLTLMNRSYQVTNPNEATPTPETFLFREIASDLFAAQGSNGHEWAYGLVAHSDKYYLFTFNRPDQSCITLSTAERRRFGTTLKGDGCSVSNLKDLTGLLLYLRSKHPDPTSAFTVR